MNECCLKQYFDFYHELCLLGDYFQYMEVLLMKKNWDIYLIYFAWITDLIYHLCGRLFGNYCNTHTIPIDENGIPVYGKIKIFSDVQEIAFRLFFILIILYIIIIFIQIRRRMPVNLKNNILFSLVMVIADFVDFAFIINAITINGSLGLKFFIVALITNAFLYFLYRSQVQNGIIQWEDNKEVKTI